MSEKSFCPLVTRTCGGFSFKYIDILTLNKSAGKKDHIYLLLVWGLASIFLFSVFIVSRVFTGGSRHGIRVRPGVSIRVRLGVSPGGCLSWPLLPLSLSVTTSPPSPESSLSVRTVEWIPKVWNKWSWLLTSL